MPALGGHKTASCTLYAGTATVQVRCIPHTGYWAPATPIAVQTPITCPGSIGFDDIYEQCLLEITACGSNCRVGGWIDRLPLPVANEQP